MRTKLRLNEEPTRWLIVVTFAAAMAWVESAVVLYLRTMINRIEPYQPHPFPIVGGFAMPELIREAATLVMLFAVGLLAGKTWRSRWGYAAIAFGIWDILYYVFLKQMCGWPHSIMDWDILFLLPLPWWGPVWAPVAIALLLVAWGTLATQFPRPVAQPHLRLWALNVLGTVLALYIFMADTLRAADGGVDAIREVLPERFNWPLFSLSLCLMAAPVISLLRQICSLELGKPGTLANAQRFSCKRSPQN